MRDKELGALIARLPLINAMKTDWPYNQQANAQLIAAAPDLAAALADAVRAMDAWSTAHPDAGGVFGLLTQARAALAKAGVAP